MYKYNLNLLSFSFIWDPLHTQKWVSNLIIVQDFFLKFYFESHVELCSWFHTYRYLFDYKFYSILLALSIKLLITWVLVQETTEIRSGFYSISLVLMEKLTYLSFLVIGESSEKAGNPLLIWLFYLECIFYRWC